MKSILVLLMATGLVFSGCTNDDHVRRGQEHTEGGMINTGVDDGDTATATSGMPAQHSDFRREKVAGDDGTTLETSSGLPADRTDVGTSDMATTRGDPTTNTVRPSANVGPAGSKPPGGVAPPAVMPSPSPRGAGARPVN